MHIRPYQPADCPQLARLFFDTVHRVNARDYTPIQLNAWASGEVDLDAWDRSFREHCTAVAVAGEEIVGFGDMARDGYLDRLYVHWAHQGQGVATAICRWLEERVPAQRYVTHASITARPFFARPHGLCRGPGAAGGAPGREAHQRCDGEEKSIADPLQAVFSRR